MPKPKFSSRRVCFRSIPIFQVVPALRGGNIRSDAPVQKLPGLALCRGRVGERIAAGVVVELILPDIGIDRQQGVRVEGVLVSRRDVPGQHPLTLVLA